MSAETETTEVGDPRAEVVDHAPAWVADGTPEPLRAGLIDAVGSRGALMRATDIVRFASDASPYLRFPQAVAQPRDESEIIALLAYARRVGLPLTFRGGGTSLNGQAQSDGLLVDLRRHLRGIEVLEDGAAARAQPGAILGHVNRALAPHRMKLGPDPASTDIATVGGVIANNSGGMRCGTTRDSYSTLRSLRFLLPSGTVIDTAAPGAVEEFARLEPELHRGLAEIRDEIRGDGDLRERIRRKFEIKNTMGYRLCAFLDADEPLEIFRRLLVGSEGTLACVTDATFETVPVPERTTVAWIHFPDIAAATGPVRDLVAAGARAVEMMVAPALMVAANSIPGAPEYWKELPPDSAALLVEFGADDADGLAIAEAAADQVLESHEVLGLVDWSRDEHTIEIYWTVREGMHGLVGKLRPPGTALIVEDVCVPPDLLAACAADLRELLGEHGFLTGVAGHTSAGNLHFMLTPDFAKPEDRERYGSFISKMVELVIDRYDGSLKAEHGTGISMAPFVEREWGRRATELMWRVKELADPDDVLSPGVLLNRDPDCHLEHLKATPEIHETVTGCVECGFCEPVCPSRDLTLTPRQRIVIAREIARQPTGSDLSATLSREYDYDGLQTCAVDSSCRHACPLGIDTGAYVKALRADRHTGRAEREAERLARRWEVVERGARAGLGAGEALARALGDRAVTSITGAVRAAGSEELIPGWIEPMPPPQRRGLPRGDQASAAAVYLPACINRIFGTSHPEYRGWMGSLPEAMVEVSRRAGIPVWIPPDAPGTCCGTPFSSKGYRGAHEWMANRTIDSLWHWSGAGRLPIVIDASSCTQGVIECADVLSDANRERHAELQIVDSVEWAHLRLLPALEILRLVGSLTIHPTCSGRELGLGPSLIELCEALAERVVVPDSANCCGFAGDRGFLHPELTASALAEEAAEVAREDAEVHVCHNRTCEIGLERETGEPYASVIYLLEELTRPA